MRSKPFGILLLAAACCAAAVPTPKEHLGFAPGDDYKLAGYDQISGYFRKLAASSDRIRLVEFGKTTLGRPMYVAFLSAPENLEKLERYREISRRLALGEAAPEEARALAAEGRAIVWIDSGLHASEVAPVQHAPELAWRMLTDETPEMQAIRQNVILMQVPVINPDGLDWVAQWYAKNVGTPYANAPLPWLYQKYSGHDNNRDFFMLNLQETRHVTRLLFQEWFPQIVYNQHQQPPFPARIFVPPYGEPLNPNIPATVMDGINLIGAAMRERFAREGKPGVLSYLGFDAWWNGGLRSVPAFHNMHGILTETASSGYGNPRIIAAASLPAQFSNGIPTRQPSVFYERPYLGGKWTVRDAIEYMLTADFAILELAASRRSDYLLKAWTLAQESIEAGRRGKPFAYIVAPQQWDGTAALDMLERMAFAGVQVRRARAPFRAASKDYPAGSWVVPASQPFRPYLVDLLEPQRYPELKTGSTGPTKRPYDIAGWTLNMQMGVAMDRVDEPFEAELIPVPSPLPEGRAEGSGTVILLDHRENAAFLATADALKRGGRVHWSSDGAISVEDLNDSHAAEWTSAYGVSVRFAATAPRAVWHLAPPRVALYHSFTANPDEGWTEWLLDRYQIRHTLIENGDLQKPDLRARFDTILLASQSATSILHGFRAAASTPRREGEPEGSASQRPEFLGGIGAAGTASLEKFVNEGGTLVALDAATELPLQFFPLSILNVLARPAGGGPGEPSFFCPGSLLRLTVEPDQPLAFGMPREAIAFYTGGQAFDGSKDMRSVARFASQNVLASGWLSGERAIAGKHALVELPQGRGRVVLFAFRPQFRGQPAGTFKFLLNAVYLGSAKSM